MCIWGQRKESVLGTTSCVSKARQGVSAITRYSGIPGRGTGVLSEITPCVGGGKTGVYKATPYMGEGKTGISSILSMYWHTWTGQRDSIRKNNLYAKQQKSFGNHVLGGEGEGGGDNDLNKAGHTSAYLSGQTESTRNHVFSWGRTGSSNN